MVKQSQSANQSYKTIKKGTNIVLRNYIQSTRKENNQIEIENASVCLRDLILKRVKDSIDKLYKEDIFLLKHKMHEVTLCGRLAIYLQKQFSDFKGYSIDIEYYLLKESPKDYKGGNKERIRCDILLHSRGWYESRVDILLAIEAKYKTKNPAQSIKSDMERLKELATPYKIEMPGDAVHDTLMGLFLRFHFNKMEGYLVTSEGDPPIGFDGER